MNYHITRRSWYTNIDVLFEIIKQHIHRETFFLPYKYDNDKKLNTTQPIRWLKCFTREFLKKNFERYEFLDNHMNLYYSITTYKDFPTFSWNWRIKSQQQEIWLTEFKNYVDKYDLFIETDSLNLNESINDAIQIRDLLLHKYKIKFSCGFSGSKGIHFIVPSDEFSFLGLQEYDEGLESKAKRFNELLLKCPVPIKNKNNVFDKVLLFKVLNFRLKTLLSCDTIDTSISDIKRVKKTFYSWDVKSNLIALPLSDNQLDNFNIDIVTPINVLKNKIYKRGLLYRNEDKSIEERQKGIIQLLVDFGIFETKTL